MIYKILYRDGVKKILQWFRNQNGNNIFSYIINNAKSF